MPFTLSCLLVIVNNATSERTWFKAISINAIQSNVAMIDVSHYISICISHMTRVLLHRT